MAVRLERSGPNPLGEAEDREEGTFWPECLLSFLRLCVPGVPHPRIARMVTGEGYSRGLCRSFT